MQLSLFLTDYDIYKYVDLDPVWKYTVSRSPFNTIMLCGRLLGGAFTDFWTFLSAVSL